MNAIISQDSKNQSLSVVIPDELKDYTYIQVKIAKSENIIYTNTYFLSDSNIYSSFFIRL